MFAYQSSMEEVINYLLNKCEGVLDCGEPVGFAFPLSSLEFGSEKQSFQYSWDTELTPDVYLWTPNVLPRSWKSPTSTTRRNPYHTSRRCTPMAIEMCKEWGR